ncbi:hypothetical protein SCHPADRAFT_792391, partial [Schizopora paradoxa]
MGKRKKSSRKPQPSAAARRRGPLDTRFRCIFCFNENAVSVKVSKAEGTATLNCERCFEKFEATAHHLTEPVDVYNWWKDAVEEAQPKAAPRRPSTS